MKRLAFLLSLLGALLFAGESRATEPTHEDSKAKAATTNASAAEPPKNEAYWYGWQTLLVDGASIGVLLATVPETAAILPTIGYVIGGPIVHLLNGEGGRAAGSLALRVGAPLLFGGVAAGLASATSTCEGQCDGAGIGTAYVVGLFGLIGAAAAITNDAAALARGTRVRDPSTITVGVQPTRGGLSAGLAGSF